MPTRGVTAEEFAKKTRAVIVGVGQFSDSAITGLKSPNRESNAIRAALTDPFGCAVPKQQVVCLTDHEATRVEVLNAINLACEAADSTSILLFYFAGHAFRLNDQFHFCPHDAQLSRLADTSISANHLERSFRAAAARGVLLVFDCCVGAGFAEGAPAFFRSTGRSDFRLLLSASREGQPSWELPDGEGTLFSRQLIGILRGTKAAGRIPGQITFFDLVEAVGFGIEEDRRTLYGTAPPQDLVVAGTYGADPLLFVHKRLALSQLTVVTGRVSRAHMRRVVRRTLLALVAGVCFAALSYLTFLDQHEYAVAEGGLVRMYRGYPGLGAPTYPRLLRTIRLDLALVRDDSALRQAKPLIAPLGAPVEPALEQELNPAGRAIVAVNRGQSDVARPIVLDILRNGSASQPAALAIARGLLRTVARPEDKAWIHDMLMDEMVDQTGDIESHTDLVLGLLTADREDALNTMRAAPSAFRHERVLPNLGPPCTDALRDYLGAALRDANRSGGGSAVILGAVRMQCPPPAEALIDGWSGIAMFKADDVSMAASTAPPIAESVRAKLLSPAIRLAAGDDQVLRKLMLHAGWRPTLPCPTDEFIDLPTYSMAAVYQAIAFADHPGCNASIRPVSFDTPTGSPVLGVEIFVAGHAMRIRELDVSELLTLIDAIERRPAREAIPFLLQTADEDAPLAAARAMDTLRRFDVPAPAPTGKPFIDPRFLQTTSEELRRAVYLWKGEGSPRQAVEDLLDRLSERSYLEAPGTLILLRDTDKLFPRLRTLASAEGVVAARAASVLAARAGAGDMRNLLVREEVEVREAALDYVAANEKMDEIVTAIGDDMTIALEDRTALRKTQERRHAFDMTIGALPAWARAWWLRRTVEESGSSVCSSASELGPGLCLWLWRNYDELSHAAAEP